MRTFDVRYLTIVFLLNQSHQVNVEFDVLTINCYCLPEKLTHYIGSFHLMLNDCDFHNAMFLNEDGFSNVVVGVSLMNGIQYRFDAL